MLLSGKLKGVLTSWLYECKQLINQALQYLTGTAITSGKLEGVHINFKIHLNDQCLQYLAESALPPDKLEKFFKPFVCMNVNNWLMNIWKDFTAFFLHINKITDQ